MKEVDKAYKLLAIQEKISNRAAKELIDRGIVYALGKKIVVARADIKKDTKFKIEHLKKPTIIFEDEKIVAINKPAFLTSEEIAKMFNKTLLHRLDRETTGVLLLSKDENFTKDVILAFKDFKVEKVYLAIVQGKFFESTTINSPILTLKTKTGAYSKVSKDGKEALSYVNPMLIDGKKSLVEVKIKTGRTHQIRVHLKSIGFPIVGDEKYGGKPNNKMLLHEWKISLLGYDFEAPIPEDFKQFSKNL